MKQLLDKVILNNTVQSYLTVILVIIGILLIKRIISKYLAKLMFRLVGKAGKNVARDSFLNLVVQPLDYFLLLMIGIISLDQLVFPSVLNVMIYRISLKSFIDALADGILIGVFIWLCLRLIEFIALVLEQKANMTADMTDNQLIIFFFQNEPTRCIFPNERFSLLRISIIHRTGNASDFPYAKN